MTQLREKVSLSESPRMPIQLHFSCKVHNWNIIDKKGYCRNCPAVHDFSEADHEYLINVEDRIRSYRFATFDKITSDLGG